MTAVMSHFYCAAMYFHMPAFQISFTEWPSDLFHGDFYDMYISGRPYEHRYAALRTSDPSNISNADLPTVERLVKKNFLSAYIFCQTNVQEYRDTPKLTSTSFLSQLGATTNLWAGITVVILIEIIELFYEAIIWARKANKTGAQWQKQSFGDTYDILYTYTVG